MPFTKPQMSLALIDSRSHLSGLLLTIPGGGHRWIEFTSFHTSVAAVFVHAAVFYALNYALFTWLMARESARAETEPLLRPRA